MWRIRNKRKKRKEPNRGIQNLYIEKYYFDKWLNRGVERFDKSFKGVN